MAENKMVSFNLPSPYQAELAKIADQQRLAEVLQAQSQAPIERFSYKGIEARTPFTAGLAKLLQGFGGAYFQKQARGQEKALGEKYRAEQMGDMSELISGLNAPAVAGSAAVPETFAAPPTFAVDDEGQPMPGMSAAPAVPAVVARQAGQIDPSMMGRMKTTEGANQVLALVMAQRQAQIEAERRANEPYNLSGDQTRFQPVPGGAPRVIASGVPKTPFAPIDVSKFTPESLVAATNPDGTVDRTKLVVIPERVTGNLAELAAENADRKQKGLPPLSIVQYREQIAKAGRTPAAETYGAPIAAVDAQGKPVFLQPGRRGNAPSVIQGFTPPSTGDKALTETQGKATGFASRAIEADQILKTIGKDGEVKPSLLKAGVEAIPLIGSGLGAAVNVFAPSGPQQQVEQAQRNFINALLRQESGAAIAESEFANAQKQYFPQAGDSPELIKQKAENRQTSINALKVQAGPGMQRMPQQATATAPMRAKNAQTGAEIVSTDGGVTWQPAGR